MDNFQQLKDDIAAAKKWVTLHIYFVGIVIGALLFFKII